jgi:hypothetical protein
LESKNKKAFSDQKKNVHNYCPKNLNCLF